MASSWRHSFPQEMTTRAGSARSVISTQIRATPPARRQVLCLSYTGLARTGTFFFACSLHASDSPCFFKVSQSLSHVVMVNKPSCCRFSGNPSTARRRHWLSSDACIPDYSSNPAVAFRLFRSPFLRLVGVVVWLMHTATKMSSSYWSARKEYSPQEISQAQRQRQKKILQEKQHSHQENQRFCNSEKFYCGTVDKAHCCCRDTTRFRPWSEQHSLHCRHVSQTTRLRL